MHPSKHYRGLYTTVAGPNLLFGLYGSGVSVKCVQFRQLVRAYRVLYIELDANPNKAGPVLKTGDGETSKLTQVKERHLPHPLT